MNASVIDNLPLESDKISIKKLRSALCLLIEELEVYIQSPTLSCIDENTETGQKKKATAKDLSGFNKIDNATSVLVKLTGVFIKLILIEGKMTEEKAENSANLADEDIEIIRTYLEKFGISPEKIKEMLKEDE